MDRSLDTTLHNTILHTKLLYFVLISYSLKIWRRGTFSELGGRVREGLGAQGERAPGTIADSGSIDGELLGVGEVAASLGWHPPPSCGEHECSTQPEVDRGKGNPSYPHVEPSRTTS